MAVKRTSTGERQCYVTLMQRPSTDTVDDSLAPIDGPFTRLAEVWAKKIELGGDERFRAAQLSTKYDTRWNIHYRADMDPELVDVTKLRQLVYGSRTHDIVSATMTDRHREIELVTMTQAGA